MSVDIKNGSVWWLYQARRIATQANVAGGQITVDLTCGAGQIFKFVSIGVRNSGTNGLSIAISDEDFAYDPTAGNLATIASAAGTNCYLPSIGTSAGTSANIENSVEMFVGPGQSLSIVQTVAGLQNDTMIVSVVLLLSTPTVLIWDKSRSTNQADVTLAVSTISAANTLQAVYLP